MIPKSELVEMFNDIARSTKWDMSGEMLWGYFFTDSDPSKLEALSERLEDMGYDFVEIDEGDNPDGQLTLQVARVEVHTPDTLFERSQELSALAEEMGISAYDGVDVGSVDGDDEFDEELT